MINSFCPLDCHRRALRKGKKKPNPNKLQEVLVCHWCWHTPPVNSLTSLSQKCFKGCSLILGTSAYKKGNKVKEWLLIPLVSIQTENISTAKRQYNRQLYFFSYKQSNGTDYLIRLRLVSSQHSQLSLQYSIYRTSFLVTKRRPLEKSVVIFQTAINKYFSFLECLYQNLIACAFLKRNTHHVFLNMDFNTQHFTLLCSLQLINKDQITTLKRQEMGAEIENKIGYVWVVFS